MFQFNVILISKFSGAISSILRCLMCYINTCVYVYTFYLWENETREILNIMTEIIYLGMKKAVLCIVYAYKIQIYLHCRLKLCMSKLNTSEMHFIL